MVIAAIRTIRPGNARQPMPGNSGKDGQAGAIAILTAPTGGVQGAQHE
ncbi:hypothetical protein GRI44_07430 [Altererythrobacter confluentis]|uniref:Uncharacterized protein n=1 Tax=Allopontixanthobacter confluentis TaxID=1849021 RepID=A0A6L7GF71_9SPHN|nr:hypothetical protein [Allopontixanthobacter confluentis]MXP14579.1 hypothetical protein [Allopontixanthobacter confluentis]